MRNLITRSQVFYATMISSIFGFFGNAFATPSIDDLWTAFDAATLNTKVLTILTVFVGINLAFLTYKLIRRTMSRG